jgi:hypothetical protein
MANPTEQLIVFPNPEREGGVCCTTLGETDLTIHEIAQLVTPAGQPYILVNRSDLPPDDGFWFEAWEADFSEPDGYGINNEEWFAAHPPEDPDNE